MGEKSAKISSPVYISERGFGASFSVTGGLLNAPTRFSGGVPKWFLKLV